MNYVKINVFEMYRSELFDNVMESCNNISSTLSSLENPFASSPFIGEEGLEMDVDSPVTKLADTLNKVS